MSKYAVKTLYPDGVESPYRAVALPMFASLCLTVGAALLLAGTLAVCVSDISLHLTPAAWRTLGILLSLLVLAAFLPDMDMPFVQGLREDAKQ